MKRIIIHGLRPEYRGFIAAIQGWPTQPSLLQLENLLADQEALAKQMAGVLVKMKKNCSLVKGSEAGSHLLTKMRKEGRSKKKIHALKILIKSI